MERIATSQAGFGEVERGNMPARYPDFAMKLMAAAC